MRYSSSFTIIKSFTSLQKFSFPMKTNSFKGILLPLIAVGMFISFSFTASAQDPLADFLTGVTNSSTHGEHLKMSASKATPQIQAKLKALNDEVVKNKLTYKVGYTEAMEHTPQQLCGTIAPKTINASAVSQQESQNKQIIQKAQVELKKQGVSNPSGGVSGGVSASPTFWAGAWLTPVKNQGGCGSCWAFAACATFETTFRKFYGTSRIVDASEQDLLDCGKTCNGYDAGSCGGGYSDRAFDYMRCFATNTESYKPYVGHDEACYSKPKTLRAYTWGQVYPGGFPSVSTVKAYVQAYGAVVTYVQAEGAWFSYTGGILNGHASSSSYGINHAVTIVGWNDYYHSWIIKNSWGTSWGYSGYAYVNYDDYNIGKYIYYVYPYYSYGGVSASAATEAPTPSPIIQANY